MTPILLLFAVVAAQVVVFQYASVRLNRTTPDYLVGVEGLPVAVADRIERFRRGAGRLRTILGAFLLLVAVLASFVLPLGYGGRKLTLAAISILSSLILVVGSILDRRHFAKITAEIPEPVVRAASLRRRTIRDFYHPAWEAVPIALILGTVAVSVGLVAAGPLPDSATLTGLGDLRVWILPLFQVAVFALLSILISQRASTAGCLSSRTRAIVDAPEQALVLDQRARSLEIRYGLYAKILLMLQLGVIQLRRLLPTLGREPGVWLLVGQWLVVALLLVTFAGYLVRLTRTKGASTVGRPAEHAPVGGKGGQDR